MMKHRKHLSRTQKRRDKIANKRVLKGLSTSVKKEKRKLAAKTSSVTD
ncbi:MAG: hypothetical protein ACXQS3_03350 [Candidatus Methanofastidiosia archaeon]